MFQHFSSSLIPVSPMLIVALLLSIISPTYAWEPDAEYNAQWGLAMIHANEAYKLGFTGQGITVGIVDTGIDPNHQEFPYFRISGYDFIDNTSELSDPDGHGSHVAGIIGAAKNGIGMHGVAYNSSLVSAAAIGSYERSAPLYAVVNAMNYLLGLQGQERVSIFNHSWGTNDSIKDTTVDYILNDPEYVAELEIFRQAIQSNCLMVFSAGNEANTEVSVYPGLPYLFPELRPGWLAVVSLGPNDEEPNYTNRAGIAKEWTITAPGGGDDKENDGVYSVGTGETEKESGDGKGYATISGTSMAAPHVSGAAALVWEAFPYYTAAQVVQTLLLTATDIGVSGIDDIYGWGLLDVGKAVKGVQVGNLPDYLPNDYVLLVPLSGNGSLTVSNGRLLTLAGDNNYSGSTFVENGSTLVVNGTLTSLVKIDSSSTLQGSGFINNSVELNGTLSPGNSPGTLTVVGDFNQADGSNYLAELGGTSPDQYDRIIVGGQYSCGLNVTLKPQLYGGYQPQVGDAYTIVYAVGGGNGSYATIDQSNSPTAIQFDVLYEQDKINLYSTPNDYNIVNSLGWKWNSNQTEVARIWEKDRPNPGTVLNSSQEELYRTLFPLNSAGLRQAASQMSGQLIADSQAGALDQLRDLNHTLGRMVVDRKTVKLFSNSINIESCNVSGRSLRSSGAVANYEIGEKDDRRWGVGIGYSSGKIKSDSGPGSATVESYGLHYYTYRQPKDWYLQTQIGFGQTQQIHDREIGQVNVSGKTSGEHFFGRLAVGKEESKENTKYGLEAALLWESVKRKSMTEIGNNTYTVSASSAHDQRLASEVALTGKHILQSKPGLTTTLDAKLGWIHDFIGLDNQVDLKWRGETMNIKSEKMRTDAIQYGLGLSWQWEKGCQLQLSALGEHRSNSSRFNLEATMNYTW